MGRESHYRRIPAEREAEETIPEAGGTVYEKVTEFAQS
jgi:hypothetical protein